MSPLKLRLKPNELKRVRYLLGIEEQRLIRLANMLNCLRLGYVSSDIAAILNVDPKTVTNVGNAYTEVRLDTTLFDEERSGRPIAFDERERSRIVAMVCLAAPKGFYRWTLDLIVEQAQNRESIDDSISRETIRMIFKEHDPKPWQEKMWCIGEIDEKYIRRMEDVLEVYQRPYNEDCPVVCFDEKPVAVFSDASPRLLRRGPGEIMNNNYEYMRAGSANVFCAVEPTVGRYINAVTECRDGLELSMFMTELAGYYPAVTKIVLVMDNLSTRSCAILQQHMGEGLPSKIADLFEIHYTPVHASSLNPSEIAIGMYSRQCLGDDRVGDIGNPKKMTVAWKKSANQRRPSMGYVH